MSTATTSAANLANNTLVTAVANCPAGKVLLGGGAKVTTTAPSSRAVLTSSYPSGAAQWTAVATTNAALGAGNTMTVTAYVVCTA